MPMMRVVLAELVAQPPRVNPYDRIGRSIEIAFLAIERQAQDLLLQRVGLAGQTFFDDVTQETAQTLGPAEDLARQDLVQL